MASHNQLRGLESWNLHMFFFLSAKMLCHDLSEDFFHQNMMVQWCHASPRSSGRGQERIVRNENPILGFKFRRTASSDWSGANPLAFAQGRTLHNTYILSADPSRRVVAIILCKIQTCRKIQNPKSEIQNPKSKIQDPKSKIQNPKSKIQDPRSKIQNPKSKIQNPKSKRPRLGLPHKERILRQSKIQNPKS